MTELSRADAVELLDFIGDAQAPERPEPFTTDLLDRLAVVMGCAFATYQQVDLRRRVVYNEVVCSNEARHAKRPEVGSRELRKDGVVVRLASGEVKTWSDEFDRSARWQFETLPWTREFGIVDCAVICFGSGADRALLILHAQDRDFTQRDRRKLHALHPHVHALIREARARKLLASLTGATEAQDESDGRGFLLFDSRLVIEQGSPAALRMLRTWFGETDGQMPGSLADWLLSPAYGREPLRIEGRGKRLLVEAPTVGALVMTEEHMPPVSLTAREIEVLSCIAAGRPTSEVARLLWVTPATVSKHLEHIYRKLGVSSRTAALAAVGLRAESLPEKGDSPHGRESRLDSSASRGSRALEG
jgi:DNA-binding CsgD family transcriptional regulator